jgi:hypothetical protein
LAELTTDTVNLISLAMHKCPLVLELTLAIYFTLVPYFRLLHYAIGESIFRGAICRRATT